MSDEFQSAGRVSPMASISLRGLGAAFFLLGLVSLALLRAQDGEDRVLFGFSGEGAGIRADPLELHRRIEVPGAARHHAEDLAALGLVERDDGVEAGDFPVGLLLDFGDFFHHLVGLEGGEFVGAERALHEFFQPVLHFHVGGGLGEVFQAGCRPGKSDRCSAWLHRRRFGRAIV